MKITINGECHVTDLEILSELLEAFVDQDKPFAIAVNEAFVPKYNYSNIRLNDGDSIEILSPMQGG